MGWKTINGHRYYYRHERDGGQVKTSFVGAGETARLFAILDAETQRERREERDATRAARRAAEAEERDIAEWFARVEAVADAAMIAAGFHKHKRHQWRRRRDGQRIQGD